MRKLEVEFTFAGFNFPRYIPELTKSKYDKRTSRSVYYVAPRPDQAGKGYGFYLNDAGSPSRWQWCDKVDGARIKHTGWFCDEFRDSKIRGLVVRLPHSRFLAGWSMGEGMCGEVDGALYTDEVAAAYAADSMAEDVAEREREYQEEQEELRRQEEENQGSDEEETEGY